MSANCWLTETEWSQLHKAVRPNPYSMADFKTLVFDGNLSVLKRVDLDKIVKVVKQLLVERGNIREGTTRIHGTKKEVADEIKRLAMIDPDTPPAAEALPQPATNGSHAETPAAPIPGTPPNSPPGGRTAVNRLMVDSRHVRAVENLTKPLHTTVPQPTIPRPVLSENQKQRLLGHLPKPGPSKPASPFTQYESPLAPIVTSIKRIAFRQGSATHTFEIPPEHVKNVEKRTQRVLLIPMTSTTGPHNWPSAKELYIYLNNEGVASSWRRTWPGRKHELAKSYLSLDITQFLSTRGGTQRLQIDCFDKNYFATLHVVVVDSPSEKDIAQGALALALADDKNEETNLEMYRAICGLKYDDDVEAGDQSVGSKCPVSQCKINVPVRGVHCEHLQCVDMESVLRSCHIGAYWNCPICDRSLRYREMIVDTVMFAAMTNDSKVQNARYIRLDSLHRRWIPDERQCQAGESVDDGAPPITQGSQKPPQRMPIPAGSDSPLVVVASRKRPRGTEDSPIEID